MRVPLERHAKSTETASGMQTPCPARKILNASENKALWGQLECPGGLVKLPVIAT
jgi:hypothetical protein